MPRLKTRRARRNRRVYDPRIIQTGSAKSLLDEDDETLEWVVHGLLPTGGVSMLTGAPKAGKSTFARNIAAAVASGTPVIDRPTEEGLVFYVALEDRRAAVREHIAAMNLPDRALHLLRFHIGPIALDAEEALSMLVDVIQRFPVAPRLVVIDTMIRFHQMIDTNNYGEVTKVLNKPLSVAREYGTCILYVHHTRKGGKPGDSFDRVLGSTAFVGTMDCSIQVWRRGDRRFIQSEQRVGDDLPLTEVCLNGEGRIEASDPVENERSAGLAEQIVEACTTPLTETAIRRRVGGDRGRVGLLIRRLVDNGALRRNGTGRKGAPYTYGRAE